MASAEAGDMSQDSTVELALAGGAPQHFGWYRFYFEDERWEWSRRVVQLKSALLPIVRERGVQSLE